MKKPTCELPNDPNKFNKEALEWAKYWKEGNITITQVRRYYNDLQRIYRSVIETNWEAQSLQFSLIKAKAAYALKDKVGKGRDRKAKIQALYDYLTGYIDLVIYETDPKLSEEKFNLFCKHFEATLGYAVGLGIKERETR